MSEYRVLRTSLHLTKDRNKQRRETIECKRDNEQMGETKIDQSPSKGKCNTLFDLEIVCLGTKLERFI